MLPLLIAAAIAAEPTLAQAQAAAARCAAGDAAADASRTARARNAHWAPQLRAQGGAREDGRAVRGEVRLAPIIEDWTSAGSSWSVMLLWDFSQVVFAREETQLALAHTHLARVRREVQTKVAQLYVERLRLKREPGAVLELLRVTAELDALTGGLYADALERVQAQVEAGR
jgi:hypothetical protein